MPGTSTPFENEWSLLRAALSDVPAQEKSNRIRRLLTRQIQWSVLTNFADRHGAQPLLAQTLLSLGEQIPSEAIQHLRHGYQTNLHKALLLSGELIRIVECLSAAGVEVMPYKGLVLAQTLYGDIALRPAGDIDLLARATDVTRIREAVQELGYKPHLAFSDTEARAYLESGYECAFDGIAGPNLLEVQWALQPRFYAVDVDMEVLFRRAVTITVAGTEMKSLSLEDTFAVLALHAAKHVWGRLIWLCDLARIASISSLNWEQIGVQAHELGTVRILRVTLLLAQRLLDAPLPAAAKENLPEDRSAAELAAEIETYITSEKTFDVESLAYFRLMLRLRERRKDRVRFTSRLILTPGPNEWGIVRLPKPLFPLYRVIRMTRLAARTVGGRF